MIFVCESLRPCIRMSEILYAQLILDTSSDLLETLQVFLLLYKAVHVVFDLIIFDRVTALLKLQFPYKKLVPAILPNPLHSIFLRLFRLYRSGMKMCTCVGILQKL